jgi:tRNA (cytidine/uridine-2'-O-)-methyltransferase
VHIVFFEPEIPQNTGSTARMCAGTGVELHLIEPLGFSLDDRYLKRAGLDYWHEVRLTLHGSLADFFEATAGGRYWFVSKYAKRRYSDADFQPDDYLIFGKETAGLPRELIEANPVQSIRIPIRESIRSLNLATSAGIVLYEALRQTGFAGL